MSKELDKATVDTTFQAIIKAKLPPTRIDVRRGQDRKHWAAAVRSVLKDLGIKNVSVITPSYSMAHSIDVRIPRYRYEDHACATNLADQYLPSTERACPQCRQQSKAWKRMVEIMEHSFPGLEDRSDALTDYYDFCWSVN